MEIHHHTHIIPPDFTHVHSRLEVTFCIQGSYTFHFETKDGSVTQSIKPGMLIMMPKGIHHGICNVRYPYDRYFFNIADDELRIIQGPTSTLNLLLHQAKQPEPFFWDLSNHAASFIILLEAMYTAYMTNESDDDWGKMFLYHYIGLFFCEMNKLYPNYFTQAASSYSKSIQQAKIWMDEHYQQSISIHELAHSFFLTPNYFSNQFTEQIGVSPQQYLTQRRLAMARMDLCSTTFSVQEIAMRNGFCDVNYFIQLFKRCYNTTPKQYQKQVIQSNRWA